MEVRINKESPLVSVFDLDIGDVFVHSVFGDVYMRTHATKAYDGEASCHAVCLSKESYCFGSVMNFTDQGSVARRIGSMEVR